jgi:hypothetical protein
LPKISFAERRPRLRVDGGRRGEADCDWDVAGCGLCGDRDPGLGARSEEVDGDEDELRRVDCAEDVGDVPAREVEARRRRDGRDDRPVVPDNQDDAAAGELALDHLVEALDARAVQDALQDIAVLIRPDRADNRGPVGLLQEPLGHDKRVLARAAPRHEDIRIIHRLIDKRLVPLVRQDRIPILEVPLREVRGVALHRRVNERVAEGNDH